MRLTEKELLLLQVLEAAGGELSAYEIKVRMNAGRPFSFRFWNGGLFYYNLLARLEAWDLVKTTWQKKTVYGDVRLVVGNKTVDVFCVQITQGGLLCLEQQTHDTPPL